MQQQNSIKKVLITWTKWKTSMTMFLDELVENSLVVNSEFLKIKNDNEVKYFKSWQDVLKLYWTIPSWTPFRFLILNDFYKFDYYIAETDINNSFNPILWTSLGTKIVDIWILTNVFPEHIDWSLIESYNDLVLRKLYLLFWSSSYKADKTTNLIININDRLIFNEVMNFIKWYYNERMNIDITKRNIYIHLVVDESIFDDFFTKKEFEQICADYWYIISDFIYYNNKELNGIPLSNFRLSFNGRYKVAAPILWILYFFWRINWLNLDIENIMFPRGLGRMEFIEKWWKIFLIDHISEKNSFQWLIDLLQENYKDKDIEMIFSLKYDASDSKINDFAEILNKLLNNWTIKKLYLYDNLQVRWKDTIKTRNWEYKSFELIKRLKEMIDNPNVEILYDRDKKIQEIIKSNKDNGKLFIISLNSIESPYFKDIFGLY